MYDFDSLVEEVLRSKPELNRQSLLERIEEKKNVVGSGYLTDQGALFLIAGELGVRLERITSTDLALKDLYIGANDITVVARVLAIYPANEYVKKDNAKGRYRRIGLFDASNVVRLTLWDERVEDIERAGIVVDTPVRVVSGYVKQGLDGKPNLNLGRRGRIERIEDAELTSKLDGIGKLARRLDKLEEGRQIIALEAILTSDPKRSDFTRPDGSAGSLLQFKVSDERGKEERRIVIWNPSIPLPNIKVGRQIRVTNLRVRKSPPGEPELHGDAGSIIVSLESKTQTRPFRVVFTEPGVVPNLLVVDEGRRVYQLELRDEGAADAKSVKVGDKVRVAPDEDLRDKLVCRSAGSFGIWYASDDMPELPHLGVKIDELKGCSWPVMVESIALSRGGVQEVHMRDGSVVKKGEIVIGDDTAEVKLVAWREQAAKVTSIEPGERVRIVGATPQMSKVGILTLQMSNFSKIEKVRGR